MSAAPSQSMAARLTLRERAFLRWLSSAGAGQRIEYHRGFLAMDRTRDRSPLTDRQRRELNAIARHARDLADGGRLLLVQRRHGWSDYSYLAQTTRRHRASRQAHTQEIQP